jgi:hypothetical protein
MTTGKLLAAVIADSFCPTHTVCFIARLFLQQVRWKHELSVLYKSKHVGVKKTQKTKEKYKI